MHVDLEAEYMGWLTMWHWSSYPCFVHFKAEEANGESKIGVSVAEQVEQQQQQLDELTEKLENAQRAQKQLFLIVFQVSVNSWWPLPFPWPPLVSNDYNS